MTVPVGRIEIVTGPMFAGKTTEMLRRVNRAEMSHNRVVIMKYIHDTRYSQDKVATHDLYMHDAIPCSTLMPHFNECMTYDTIGVDEGQFYPDLVEFAENLANNGKCVIIAALDGDFRRMPFGHVLELIPKCETITKLSAICRETGTEAQFTYRTVKSDAIELIGGAEMYLAGCRSMYTDKPTNGEISLTVGPVKSGKTTELCRLLNRHFLAGRKVVLIRPSNTSDHHNPKYEVIKSDTLPDPETLKDYQVIGVDEGQIYENIPEWADKLAFDGKLVFVVAAEGDGHLNPYPTVINLAPKCEHISKLDSICPMTGAPAPFSYYMTPEKIIPISRGGILMTKYLNEALSHN